MAASRPISAGADRKMHALGGVLQARSWGYGIFCEIGEIVATALFRGLPKKQEKFSPVYYVLSAILTCILAILWHKYGNGRVQLSDGGRSAETRESNMDTMSNLARSIGAGVFTLAFLSGVGYLLYIALFSVAG